MPKRIEGCWQQRTDYVGVNQFALSRGRTRVAASVFEVYIVETDQDAIPDLAALPAAALSQYADVVALLELAPWSGAAYNRRHPDAAMRTLTFGSAKEGLVVYLILEDQLRVVVLRVLWVSEAEDPADMIN
jgi:hypothetical protein